MITVVGGTYREIDHDSQTHEIYGSGLRACIFLLENKCEVNFSTIGNNEIELHLEMVKNIYPKFAYNCEYSDQQITFKYNFALEDPQIFPSSTNIEKVQIADIKQKNIICYGMLEGEYKVNAEKVIYDPQTTINPVKFSDFGKSNELIYIINRSEAEKISNYTNDEDIKNFFFLEKNVLAIVIKNGPRGAKVYLKNSQHNISSYITDNVFKIGSGDIFTASFAYYWMKKGFEIEKCAKLASLSTAYFCDIKAYLDSSNKLDVSYPKYISRDISGKQIYIAAPFFSLAELILVDNIRNAFLSFGVKVFSPYHDIGLGNNPNIAEKDIEGLKKSDVIFCVFDNLDSGTLIESGFALAKDKKIIGYHRTCEQKDLLMLSSTNIKLFTHLTTAIYQTIWSL